MIHEVFVGISSSRIVNLSVHMRVRTLVHCVESLYMRKDTNEVKSVNDLQEPMDPEYFTVTRTSHNTRVIEGGEGTQIV